MIFFSAEQDGVAITNKIRHISVLPPSDSNTRPSYETTRSA